MNLAEVIHSVKWSCMGRNFESYVEDDDFEDNVLTMVLITPTLKLFDYVVVVDDEEIEIGEIDFQLRYNVRFKFDSIDIIKFECSYTTSLELRGAFCSEMSDHENLRSQVGAQIESDISYGRIAALDESTLEVTMW